MKPIIYILSLVTLFWSCSETPSESVSEEATTDLITLTADQMTYNKIATSRLERGPLFHKIKATGMVDVPPNHSIKLSSPLEAYIADLYVLPGDRVTKGQVIAHLSHPSVAQVQKDYLSTRAELSFVEKDLRRKEGLLDGNAVSQKSYDQLISQVTEVSARLKSLEAELNRLGINASTVSNESISQTLKLKAPISGVVTDMFRKTGEYVSAADPVVSILNRDHEHIELQVFQHDLNKVKKGMPVNLLVAGDDEVYDGEVFLVNTQLNKETLSANIHVHPGEKFPDMAINSVVFGEIIYQTDTTYRVPKSELIRQGNAFFIFQKEGDGFRKVEVETGFDDGENVEIIGPKALFEEEIVTKGNYYLNG